MINESDRQKRLDALLGRALRDKAFRDKLVASPHEVAKEAGLAPEEMELVAGGLSLGTTLSPQSLAWCTEKTCNEKGGARVVMFSPNENFNPVVSTTSACPAGVDVELTKKQG